MNGMHYKQSEGLESLNWPELSPDDCLAQDHDRK